MTLATTQPSETKRASVRSLLRRLGPALALAWILIVSIPAHAGEPYDPKRAGNPLRIAAYIVHPVGVVLDYLIFRPAWWIGQHEPFKTLFGVTD
jgi:hypothetical protein